MYVIYIYIYTESYFLLTFKAEKSVMCRYLNMLNILAFSANEIV